MILTTHALTGAVIGKSLENPWLIIILSIAVHFIMDTFRHGEYVELFNDETGFKKSGWKVVLDLFSELAIIFSFMYFSHPNSLQAKNILLGSSFSIFPDFITFLYWLFRRSLILKKYYQFHSWLHKYPRQAPERQWNLRNARNDILISAIAITLLFLT